jgi:DNA-binding response OmpR family regulator
MTTHPSILLIDDSPGECELFRLALGQSGLDVVLYTEHDTEAALHFLADRTGHHQSSLQARSSPLQEGGLNWSPTARVERGSSETARSASTGDQSGLPSVILLDWHLGKQNGDGLLKQLRSDTRFASIPIVVFTTSDASTDLAAGYANGANGYVVKPGTFDELVRFVRDLCSYWLTWNRTLSRVETRC